MTLPAKLSDRILLALEGDCEQSIDLEDKP